jgi:hypothetical protein
MNRTTIFLMLGLAAVGALILVLLRRNASARAAGVPGMAGTGYAAGMTRVPGGANQIAGLQPGATVWNSEYGFDTGKPAMGTGKASYDLLGGR